MATRKNQQFGQTYENANPNQNDNYYSMAPTQRTTQRSSIVGPVDMSEIKKSLIRNKGFEYQLMPVEIEKDAELGVVLGQIEGEKWIFIDEILPNGMIEMHGTLKEGDYLLQAGVYSLTDIDITTALLLVERAYEEGRKTVSFVAARQQKADTAKGNANAAVSKQQQQPPPAYEEQRKEARAQSFVDYENAEEEEYKDDGKDVQNKPKGKALHSNRRTKPDDTQF
ncbi:unnamed protein product [Adineta steineri]|uniref:PDZ domain-containing protein n=2 Tax=Adineta steineri TaxID=433720 RepID=A0A814L8V0_9BILA|nr:unnamed protein product [Adineta steineri]CAF1062774.1 unnamed protein product [Adineta steineri]